MWDVEYLYFIPWICGVKFLMRTEKNSIKDCIWDASMLIVIAMQINNIIGA